jgi:hypothetical protein
MLDYDEKTGGVTGAAIQRVKMEERRLTICAHEIAASVRHGKNVLSSPGIRQKE